MCTVFTSLTPVEPLPPDPVPAEQSPAPPPTPPKRKRKRIDIAELYDRQRAAEWRDNRDAEWLRLSPW